jgi:hypothetical protein
MDWPADFVYSIPDLRLKQASFLWNFYDREVAADIEKERKPGFRRILVGTPTLWYTPFLFLNKQLGGMS